MKSWLFFTVPNGVASTILQEATLDIIPNAQCDTAYDGQYDITDNMICTLTAGKDACQVNKRIVLFAYKDDSFQLIKLRDMRVWGCKY